jgi:hypothetical protein
MNTAVLRWALAGAAVAGAVGLVVLDRRNDAEVRARHEEQLRVLQDQLERQRLALQASKRAEPLHAAIAPGPEANGAMLANQFASRATADDWADKASDAFKAALEKIIGPQSKLDEVSCRAGMCRITVVHRDPSAHEQLSVAFHGMPMPMPVSGRLERAEVAGATSTIITVVRAEDGVGWPHE